MMIAAILVGSVLACSLSASPIPENQDYRQEIEQWRKERVERLKAEDGWLTLVGLHWLEDGTQSIGSAADNDLVLSVGPQHLGTIAKQGGKILFSVAPHVDVAISGTNSREANLESDRSGNPTVVRFGGAQFIVVERSGRFGLRVKDPHAPTRTAFSGLDYFKSDPDWRIKARFVPHPAGKTISIASVINTLDDMPNPGALHFKKGGKAYRLEVVDEGDGSLFIIFADRTNGKSTYGPGRFLYADKPVGGETIIDFNKAYNPPCAFNAYSTCPLPPPENRLDLAITAGEKKY